MLVALFVRMMRRSGLMCLVDFRTCDEWAPESGCTAYLQVLPHRGPGMHRCFRTRLLRWRVVLLRGGSAGGCGALGAVSDQW